MNSARVRFYESMYHDGERVPEIRHFYNYFMSGGKTIRPKRKRNQKQHMYSHQSPHKKQKGSEPEHQPDFLFQDRDIENETALSSLSEDNEPTHEEKKMKKTSIFANDSDSEEDDDEEVDDEDEDDEEKEKVDDEEKKEIDNKDEHDEEKEEVDDEDEDDEEKEKVDDEDEEEEEKEEVDDEDEEEEDKDEDDEEEKEVDDEDEDEQSTGKEENQDPCDEHNIEQGSVEDYRRKIEDCMAEKLSTKNSLEKHTDVEKDDINEKKRLLKKIADLENKLGDKTL